MTDFTKYENGQVVVLSEEEVIALEAERIEAVTAANERSNRLIRNMLLSQTDWIIVKSTEAATEIPANIITYRQALRDITNHPNWPNLQESDWPSKP